MKSQSSWDVELMKSRIAYRPQKPICILILLIIYSKLLQMVQLIMSKILDLNNLLRLKYVHYRESIEKIELALDVWFLPSKEKCQWLELEKLLFNTIYMNQPHSFLTDIMLKSSLVRKLLVFTGWKPFKRWFIAIQICIYVYI